MAALSLILAAEDTDPGSPTSLLADHRTESSEGSSPRARPVQPPPLPSGTLAALDQIPDVEADALSGMVALAEGASAFILEACHTPADQSGSKPEPQRVAVKLARTKEGMIKADVEAEVRLLHTLSRLEGADEAAAAAAAERGDGNESGSGSEAAAGTNDGRAYVVKFLGSGFHHDGRRFLILELCASTLEQLLNVAVLPNNGGWMQKMRGGDRRQDNSIGGRSGGPPVVSLSRALKIGFELTLALQWLHTAAIPGCCVVHRDIKPSNIGLTSTGSVRLLDLGLARVVPRTTLDHSADAFAAADGGEEGGGDGGNGGGGDLLGGTSNPVLSPTAAGFDAADAVDFLASANERHLASAAATAAAANDAAATTAGALLRALPPYQMTGYTGSLRYMAPEVARQTPYNETCDIYSVGLVLWEVCSLER